MKRGYRIYSTDEQIMIAMKHSLEQRGRVSIKSIVSECHCGTKRVHEIANSLGIELAHINYPRPRKPGIDSQFGDNTIIHTCQEALKMGGLNNPLGELLSILTGVPLRSILRMADGHVTNVDRQPREGAISRGYIVTQRSNFYF
jgi:phosphoribosylpyrophosphate synthetase